MTDTTRYPLLSIIAILLIASTVDWAANLIFGGF